MMGAVTKPTIGIIGTGAIGGFYGLMLARAGFDVHFLLRSEFSAVAGRGLRLDSAMHGALTLNPVQAYSNADLEPRHAFPGLCSLVPATQTRLSGRHCLC